MPYTAPVVQQLISRETVQRKVLVAVEVVDPIAQELISSSVLVEASGLTSVPILSWSGRFVWLEEEDKWPAAISVKPYRLPFEPQDVVPPRPPNFPVATSEERRVRIVLHPTPAYPFAGVTAVRGLLRVTSNRSSAPMRRTRVQIKWFDKDSQSWQPATPPAALDPYTDVNGQFAVFVRLNKQGTQEPDLQKGMLKLRLEFTSADFIPETRTTPEDYPFVADPSQGGRVPEGQLLSRDVTLAWADLLTV
jgi:hypothetical protein